jgi:predicted metal-dependent enzyme (double-stranded beta helix superfamily)
VSQLAHRRVINPLLDELDRAVEPGDISGTCTRVKQALARTLTAEHDFLLSEFTQPVACGYARRLLHRDPRKRYSVVMMVWDQGQGTPLHDHGGHWCVEGVYQGKIEVVSYDLVEYGEADRMRFTEKLRVTSNVGGTGALIPPYEYHTIHNRSKETAITMHVYEGEIATCNIFEPLDEQGWYKRVSKELSYS